ncbi:serine hydrolase domain-containing protein [Chryseomicrobium imtechense]
MIKTLDMKPFENAGQELIDKYLIPGVAIGIAQDGELVYGKGFGYRNIEKEKPVTMETIYGIASVTKSFTCVAIMQLQEQGKLNVHDPVVKYLPEFKTPTDKTDQMTIHHFMTHSAGLPPLPSLVYANKRSFDSDPSVNDYPGLKLKEEEEQGPIDTFEELMEFIGKQQFELLGDPGNEFSYSNDSYALLGAIIARVSEQSYEDFVKEHILEPAGMNHSGFLIEEFGDYDNITSLYAIQKGENSEEVYEAPVWWDSPSMRAAGYLKSTVEDMLKYAEIFRNNGKVGDNQILSEESVKEMIKPHIECSPGRYYGYGLMITPDYYGGTLVEHGGNLKAIASQLSVIPERGVSAMILTNLAAVPASTIMARALNVYEGREFDASPVEFDDYTHTAEELAEFVGEYVSNEGMKLTVDLKQDSLEFSVPGFNFPVKSIGKDLFLADVNDQKEIIRFVRNSEGKIDRVAYHYRQFPKTN